MADMKGLTTLGLLTSVALALAALVGAPTAAATSTFTSSGSGVNVTSTNPPIQYHVFILESEAECEEVTFTGQTTGASSETLTLKPTYKKCKAFGFANATVTTGTCSYTFKAATDAGGSATMSLSGCADATKGIQIEVNVPFIAKCVVDMPHQSISGLVHYTNKTPTVTTMDIEFDMTAIGGIMYDVTTSTGACPLTTGTKGAGGYYGVSTVTAADNNITWSA